MSRPGKETLFGHVQYATLGDVWITFVITAVSWVGFSIVCLGIGIVLEMFGVPNRVLRWILPVAYLAFLAVTPWILARKAEYRLLLVDVRFWIMLMALAIFVLLIVQIDPWWLGVVIFWGVMVLLFGVLWVEQQGKMNFAQFHRRHAATGDNVE